MGHLYEKVIADVITRFQRLLGKDVFFLTGTDENAQKNERAAKEAGIPVKEFVDRNAEEFRKLCRIFNISYNDFIRTTEERHTKVAKLIFQKLFENGDIYKGYYEGYYCYGCEEFKTEKELVDGKCLEHDKKCELLKEESYFFRLSKYQEEILKLISNNFIMPQKYKNEMLSRIDNDGLRDVSVSRPNVKWGIETPIDSEHKIYVWIEALVNYISAIGYPDNENFKKYWPADIHLIGKGINWFHSVIWPAILLSAKISLPKLILVHGYITIENQKLSKTTGKIVDPFELTKKYPVDSLRYFLVREIPFGEDGDFSEKKLIERNNGELVANVGNFIHRTLTFVFSNFNEKVPKPEKYDKDDEELEKRIKGISGEVEIHIERLELDKALKSILDFCSFCNQYFQKKQPWSNKETASTTLYLCANAVRTLGIVLYPFLPNTAEKLWKLLDLKDREKIEWSEASKIKLNAGFKIKKPEILFKIIE